MERKEMVETREKLTMGIDTDGLRVFAVEVSPGKLIVEGSIRAETPRHPRVCGLFHLLQTLQQEGSFRDVSSGAQVTSKRSVSIFLEFCERRLRRPIGRSRAEKDAASKPLQNFRGRRRITKWKDIEAIGNVASQRTRIRRFKPSANRSDFRHPAPRGGIVEQDILHLDPGRCCHPVKKGRPSTIRISKEQGPFCRSRDTGPVMTLAGDALEDLEQGGRNTIFKLPVRTVEDQRPAGVLKSLCPTGDLSPVENTSETSANPAVHLT